MQVSTDFYQYQLYFYYYDLFSKLPNVVIPQVEVLVQQGQER